MVVAAVGPGVTRLKEGDPVGLAWLHDILWRMRVLPDRLGQPLSGAAKQRLSVNGSFAEYAIGSAAYVGRLPNNPDFVAMAPILCAVVTTYKGIKETEAKPGEWIVISGVGGLGQLAIEYAKAMGLHVAAVDVTEGKLAIARESGAEVTANAKSPDAVAQIVKQTGGGAHGALVTAVSPSAFSQAIHMVRRKGTISLAGLPPGNSRRQFSTWFSAVSRSAARSWAAVKISRKRSSSPQKGRSIPTTTR